jgi:hypothetical protein
MNLEVIKNLTKKLGILDSTTFCINGQQAIDVAKNELDMALQNHDQDQTIKPVPLMLLDF